MESRDFGRNMPGQLALFRLQVFYITMLSYILYGCSSRVEQETLHSTGRQATARSSPSSSKHQMEKQDRTGCFQVMLHKIVFDLRVVFQEKKFPVSFPDKKQTQRPISRRTNGGIKVDASLRALDENNEPIEGPIYCWC